MLAWIIISLVIAVIAIIFYALRGKGDVSASMSLWKIVDFKLDAKEKRVRISKDPLE